VADVTNYTIENASGANVRTDLNNVFAAIQSSNSKSSDLASSQCVAGMPFLNTTTNILKIRNSSNGAFTEIGNIDQANLGLLSKTGGTMTGPLLLDDTISASTPALSFDGDSDTGMFRAAANVIGFTTGGVERALISQNGIDIKDGLALRLQDSDGSPFVGLKAPSSLSADLTLTLPAAAPTAQTTVTAGAGYALIAIDESGALGWGTAGAGAQGGGTDNIFWENDQTVTQDYTISNGHNAGSFGPITIQSGVTVTVGSGETWTVV
jgi:hypothetical protein